MIMTQSVELTEGGKSVQFTDRKVPWMKLGEITDGAVTAAEAAKKGGLDFDVSLHDVYFTCEKTIVDMTNDADGTDVGTKVVDNVSPDCLRKMSNRRIVVRDDTLQPLGIVSAGYPVLQYREAFDFMDTVADAKYVAAGSLKDGRQGFMVVRAPDSMQVNVLDGGDPHEMFMVLRTSHDLTRAIEVTAMPLRGKCMNQMTLASFSTNVPHRWSVRHTSTMQAKLTEAQASIKKMGAYAERFNELAKRLSTLKVNDEKAKYILGNVIRKDAAKRDEVIDTVIEKWHNAPTVGWSGTGWGLVNAVSEYYDWGRSGGSPASRFLGALEGQTHKAINKTAVLLLRETQVKK
jgi:phage/plasmid-like protein (TIGR03299 family)